MSDPFRLVPGSRYDPLVLDDDTAERLLDGLDPADVPPAYADVARLLTGAGGPPCRDELVGADKVMAAFTATQELSLHRQHQRLSLMPKSVRARVFTASMAGALALGGGMAAAATGSLPGAAQSVASDMLAKIGITVPRPDHHAGQHPASRGSSSLQGSQISRLANNTPPPDKGPTICAQASNGHCQAGQPTGAGAGPPVATPNSGTGTANAASGGASEFGAGTTNNASGGASSAGSNNASNHPGVEHRR